MQPIRGRKDAEAGYIGPDLSRAKPAMAALGGTGTSALLIRIRASQEASFCGVLKGVTFRAGLDKTYVRHSEERLAFKSSAGIRKQSLPRLSPG